MNTAARMKSRSGMMGFTLVELMIVVAIVALLAAIAYPNYTEYVERGKRSEGRALLAAVANRMERFYSDCNSYPTTIGTANNCGTRTVFAPASSENDYYNLGISDVVVGTNYQEYTLTATPTWTGVTDCTTLTLAHDGTRGSTGGKTVDECWGK